MLSVLITLCSPSQVAAVVSPLLRVACWQALFSGGLQQHYSALIAPWAQNTSKAHEKPLLWELREAGDLVGLLAPQPVPCASRRTPVVSSAAVSSFIRGSSEVLRVSVQCSMQLLFRPSFLFSLFLSLLGGSFSDDNYQDLSIASRSNRNR